MDNNLKDICVVYHANCADGLGSAYSAWKKFGDNASYIPHDYNQKEEAVDLLIENLTDKNVFFLDVTLKRFQLLKVLESVKSLKVFKITYLI